MKAREEIEKLKREFISLNTEDERKEFDVKFHNHIDAKTDEEKQEFADAFVESAKRDTKRIREFCDDVNIRLKLEEILEVVSMSYIAKNYFHKSKGWLSQKINGNITNGTPTAFNNDEINILSTALIDISAKIHNTARSLA
jgi:hypothetical protein